MKFIRKNGRIIPIGEKQREKQITRQDYKVGAATGILSGLFWKRKGFGTLLGIGSFGHGTGTTFARLKNHSSKKTAAWEDVKASVGKSAIELASFGVAAVGVAKLSQLSKLKRINKL
jgi:hypothetical protein